jgi:hypothetical protein
MTLAAIATSLTALAERVRAADAATADQASSLAAETRVAHATLRRIDLLLASRDIAHARDLLRGLIEP